MGRILASYLIRLTLRERDDAPAIEQDAIDPPTNGAIEEVIAAAIEAGRTGEFVVRVSSERLDR